MSFTDVWATFSWLITSLVAVATLIAGVWAGIGRPLKTFAVVLAEQQAEGPKSLTDRLEALMASKVVQRFQGEGMDIPATIENYKFTYEGATLGKTQPTWADVKQATITINQAPGATA